MATHPTVSILMPAYNAADMIPRAVASVLAQDMDDWELVIASDDGADYLDALAGAGIEDARIRQVSTGRTGSGTANARNAALAAAKGEFFTPLDVDDVFAPNRLAAVLSAAEDVGAAVDNIAAVEENTGRVLAHFIPPDEGAAALTAERFYRTWIPAKPIAAAKLEMTWDTDAGLCDDVLFVAMLIDRLGPLPFISDVLQDYRVIEGSVCHRDESAAIAEASYNHLIARAETGALAFASADFSEVFCDGMRHKRALNRAFAEAQENGFAGTFQHFAAAQH
jgi:glycosyltransferase involved in cell wall biosynthesis